MKLLEYLKNCLISEGGNVFSGSSPINIEDIGPTLDRFVEEFVRIFPVAKSYLTPVNTLGSVDKKPVSGDIDIAFDDAAFVNPDDWGIDRQHLTELFAKFKKRARTSSDDDIMKRAVICSIGEIISRESDIIIPDVKSSGNGMLFSQFPQYDSSGRRNGKLVQIDTNFGNVDWLKFAYYSSTYSGNVKGLHRTQLMLTLFDVKGYVFNHNRGIKRRETGESVAFSPSEAVDLLNEIWNFNITRKILEDYFSLQDFIRSRLSESDLRLVYDTYLKILDHTRCDIPEDLQKYWVENRDRLGLLGKFLPSDSNLISLKR